MVRMLHTLFLFTFCVTRTSSWVMNVSDHEIITKFTPDVTLECAYPHSLAYNYTSNIAEINRLRILKQNSNGRWDTIAKVSTAYPAILTSLIDADVTGHVSTTSDSFLKVSFVTASSETIGHFACVIDGYGVNEECETVKTESVSIKERCLNYDDVLLIITSPKYTGDKIDFDYQLKYSSLQKSLSSLERKDESIAKRIASNANAIILLSEEQDRTNYALSNLSSSLDAELTAQREVDNARREKYETNIENLLESTRATLYQKINEVANEILAKTKVQLTTLQDRDSQIESILTDLTTANSDQIKSIMGDVLKIVRNETNNRENYQNNLVDFVTNVTENLSIKVSDIADELVNLRIELAKSNERIQDLETMMTNDPHKIWPVGSYGLVKPRSGCPDGQRFDWSDGSFRITTDKRSGNTDKTSDHSHFSGRVIFRDPQNSYNYVTLEHCLKKDEIVGGPQWPRGKYCILADNKNAAGLEGFNFGYVQFDRYNNDNDPNDVIKGIDWNVLTLDTTQIGFWCRQDGDVSNAITLPTQSPFYLYRFGGTCQSVLGMSVTDEFVYYDTMHSKDKYSNTYHPDGQIKGVQLQLCYYS